MKKWLVILFFPVASFAQKATTENWIRINQLGYTPNGIKVAVWCSKETEVVTTFNLIDPLTEKNVYTGKAESFGAYGPFKLTFRLNFSAFKKPGRYYLQVGGAQSPVFTISDTVYKGAADFCLRYMRQQRCGFNPFLKDSCHTHGGYTLYGAEAGIPDSTHINIIGGWHDASDYLQYSSTSANATYHLLMAYRDFPSVFTDKKQANGLDGKNGMADVLDEAKWGLDWLVKMNPGRDRMFNQVGDDRDHMGMRIPKEDTNFYGKGLERPVYFLTGKPQQRGKFMNATTGKGSTAGKFSSAFSLGAILFDSIDLEFAFLLGQKSWSALLQGGVVSPGFTQTASVRSPYIYAEENWVDDLELAMVSENRRLKIQFTAEKNLEPELQLAYKFSLEEPVTPWLGKDTASHYQWYPFINIGHYELAQELTGKRKDTVIDFYRTGIERVWERGKQNAFYRGVPFIWCSNNLTTSFAIQCYWYKQLTGDKTFDELEQANFDWLFGCNPWGTSMVYGLPSWGDTPSDPHSAFTHLKNYPIDGGLIDGPVYTSIYKNLIGIKLYQPDEYEEFQSNLAVYHDDYGDYSTNEPTMDGTASLIFLLAAKENETSPKSSPKEATSGDFLKKNFSYSHGGIIRGDSTQKNIALVFTGDEFAEGGDLISKTLQAQKIKASFFFTAGIYYTTANKPLVKQLIRDGHFVGNHSFDHRLCCDWINRDSLLVTRKDFIADMLGLDATFKELGNLSSASKFFLPPYEWYNDSIAQWCKGSGRQLINYTPGTLSHADYTTTNDKNYRSSETIYNSIINFEKTNHSGLNGFILLMHIGAGPNRADKFYTYLPQLIQYLKAKGYHFQRVDELLTDD